MWKYFSIIRLGDEINVENTYETGDEINKFKTITNIIKLEIVYTIKYTDKKVNYIVFSHVCY